MTRPINFLAEHRKQLSKQEIQDKKLLRYAALGFGSVTVVFLIVAGVFFYFNLQLGKVMDTEKAVRQAISNDRDTEETFVIFVRKVETLAKIYQDRQTKQAAISYFTNIFGPNIFITGINYDQKTKLLVFVIQSQDVFSLKQILQVVNSPEVAQKFTSVNPSNLSRSADGTYSVSISVAMKPVQG